MMAADPLTRSVLINWIQNNNMAQGFSGNLIFAIIARMLCGNHLKSLLESIPWQI